MPQATQRRAGFKLNDFSQHLSFGISVLNGLFFLMGVEKVLDIVPTLQFREKREAEVSIFNTTQFSSASPINFKLLWVECKVFNGIFLTYLPLIIIFSDDFLEYSSFEHSILMCPQAHSRLCSNHSSFQPNTHIQRSHSVSSRYVAFISLPK